MDFLIIKLFTAFSHFVTLRFKYVCQSVSQSVSQSVCLSVCLSVCVSSLITLNRLADFHEIWYRGKSIQGDLDVTIFNPIASIILKDLGSDL
jgi:hypothetical protein